MPLPSGRFLLAQWLPPHLGEQLVGGKRHGRLHLVGRQPVHHGQQPPVEQHACSQLRGERSGRSVAERQDGAEGARREHKFRTRPAGDGVKKKPERISVTLHVREP